MNTHILVSAIVAIASTLTYAAPFELPSLPYGYEALEPFIGKTTLMTHHLKHHAKWVAILLRRCKCMRCRLFFLVITCWLSTQNNLRLPFQRYVATAKMLIESGGALLKNLSQEQIIVAISSGAELHSDNVVLFNNVAQSWNHNFYWHSMKPGGGGEPHGMLADKIKEDFGSYDKLMGEMEKVAMTTFGSGWAWLGYHKMNGKLIVTKTTGEVWCAQ